MAIEFQIEIDDKGTPKLKKFQGEIKKTGKTSEALSHDLGVLNKAAGAVAAGAAVAGAALFKMASETANERDKITKLGRELGVTTEFLSAMGHSARLGGSDLGTVEKALGKLSKVAVDADAGLATAQRAFTDLGVEIKDSNGVLKDNDTLMLEIADKFKEMPDGVLKAAKAQEIFGKSGKSLINTLNAGSEGLKAQAEEAKALGIVFDQEAGEQAEKFNDQLLRLQSSAEGSLAQIGQEMMPILIDTFDQLSDAVKIAGPALVQTFQDLKPLITDVANLVSDTALGWAQIFKEASKFLSLKGQIKQQQDDFDEQVKKMMGWKRSMSEIKAAQKVEEAKISKAAEAREQQMELARRRADAKAAKDREALAKKTAQKEIEINRQKAEAILDQELEFESKMDSMEQELEQGLQERAQMQIEMEREITLALMSEEERRRAILLETHEKRVELLGETSNVMKLHAQEMAALDAEAKARQQEQFIAQMDNVAAVSSNIGSALANITQAEQNVINRNFDERSRRIEEEFQQRLKGKENDAAATEKITRERDEKLRKLELNREKELQRSAKKTAEMRKRAAQLEAISNTAAAVTKALPNFILATAVGIAGAAQVAAIETAQFFKGGNTGENQMISVGENGPEFVVSGSGTRAAGDEALNDLNNGRLEDAANKLLEASGSGRSGTVINIQGGVIDETFMNDVLIPRLQTYERTL